MRKTISWEGEEKVPDIIIEKGALGWEEPIPVCWNFEHDRGPFGTARDLKREDDGRITAEIDLFDKSPAQCDAKTLVENGDLAFTIFANKLAERKLEEVTRQRQVLAGRILSVNMVAAYTVGWD